MFIRLLLSGFLCATLATVAFAQRGGGPQGGGGESGGFGGPAGGIGAPGEYPVGVPCGRLNGRAIFVRFS